VARRSLLQKIPTECGVSECELETSTMIRHWSENIWCPRKKSYLWEVLSSFLCGSTTIEKSGIS